MSGKLYVVGTPIGNLSDFSPRAVETLASVDFIAAEDTRVTLKLLNHFEIKKPMVATLSIIAESVEKSYLKELNQVRTVPSLQMQVCLPFQIPERI